MELVDKWFPWRGIMTTFSIAGIFGGIALNAIFWIPTPNGLWNFKEELHWIILAIGITAPFFLLMLWFLKTDAFRYTHYPIRPRSPEGQVLPFALPLFSLDLASDRGKNSRSSNRFETSLIPLSSVAKGKT